MRDRLIHVNERNELTFINGKHGARNHDKDYSTRSEAEVQVQEQRLHTYHNRQIQVKEDTFRP